MAMDSQPPPWPQYTNTCAEAVAQAVRGDRVFDYAGVGATRELERAFSTRNEGRLAVTFNSGTSALFAALAAVGVSAADEVLVPNWTFLASSSPLLWLGAQPIFVDSGDGPNVSVAHLSAAVTPRTRAIVVTHLFGNAVDMTGVLQLGRSAALPVIADCSHAHASTYQGRPVGVFGDVTVFSLGARKMVTGGHGGVLLTGDPRIHDLALLVGHFKPRTRNDVLTPELRHLAEYGLGGNLRMSPLAAQLALDHLLRIEEISSAKRRNVAVLDQVMTAVLDPVPATAESDNGTFFDIVYRLPDHLPTVHRDSLLKSLQEAGVPAKVPSTRPLHRVLAPVAHQAPGQHPLVNRAHELADQSPSDSLMPSSSRQHDRMIGLESELFYAPDPDYARHVAAAAAPVLEADASPS